MNHLLGDVCYVLKNHRYICNIIITAFDSSRQFRWYRAWLTEDDPEQKRERRESTGYRTAFRRRFRAHAKRENTQQRTADYSENG